ncbi:MAG: DUF4293 domain-containing protein [Bacteroidia bacterium]|jgi:hypothetical protein|nr:DUF4293 domain-containing protein [Bacteroidia bacterium]MCC6769072.1 DUF4293 domain-containing protein [Bacteroidia bacterium]
MVQRIQSIWLLLSALCAGLVFLVPMGQSPDGLSLYVYGWLSKGTTTNQTDALWLLSLACTLLPLPIIFQFRKRARQKRMVLVLGVLNIVLAALLYFEVSLVAQATISMGILLIPSSVIFLVLAYLAISKDEKLIRSADRLR